MTREHRGTALQLYAMVKQERRYGPWAMLSGWRYVSPNSPK
jgi:hypothetical protein